VLSLILFSCVMSSNDDQQRWRRTPQQSASSPNPNQQRPQGQRRSVARDSGSFSGQGGQNGNTNAWERSTNRPMNHQQAQQQSGTAFTESHIPVRSFNSSAVEDYLCRGYNVELEAARSEKQAGQKPVVYKSDKGWSTPKGAWGTRANAMASGNTFLNQLKKSQVALQQNPGKE